jgi:multidrug resistance efflux pump
LSNHERIVAEIDAARADAYTRQADAELAEIRMQREYSRIKAPFDGIVLHVMAQPGQVLVNRLQSTPLVTLADPSRMKAVAQVDAATASSLSAGDLVKVGVRGEWFEGEIIGVGLEPSGSDASGVAEYALEVSVIPKQNMRLRVGEQVMVRIDE